jgi:hypothetical protein
MDVVRCQRLALDRDAVACLACDPGHDGYQARYPPHQPPHRPANPVADGRSAHTPRHSTPLTATARPTKTEVGLT